MVPASMDALVELPGVGRKTANVVLGHALGVPGLPVDRHVLRVSNRIGIAEGDDPEVVEQQLCAAMPKERWTRTSDTLILHGRRICRPRPLCDQCAVRDDCDYFRLEIARARDGKAAKPKAAKVAKAAKGAKLASPAKLAKTTTPPARGSKSVRTARR
jgi:endonuclease-3